MKLSDGQKLREIHETPKLRRRWDRLAKETRRMLFELLDGDITEKTFQKALRQAKRASH